MNKYNLFAILAIFALSSVSPAYAQETTTQVTNDSESVAVEITSTSIQSDSSDTEEEIILDDEANTEVNEAVLEDDVITASDLGVSEPKLLPNSGFYFLKNWQRGAALLFTIDPVKKAALNLKFANEKLAEAQKLAQITNNPVAVEKALEKYEKEKEKIAKRIEKIQKNPKRAARLNTLLDKLAEKEIKNQKVLERIKNKLPEKAQKRIEKRKERALQIFTNILTKTDSPEKLQKRLEKAMEAQKGSKFKNFKNLEVLKAIEERVPEKAKAAIRRAQDNSLKRLHNNIANMSPEDQEKFAAYVAKISGDSITQADILDELEESGTLPEKAKKALKRARIKTIKKIEKRIERRIKNAKTEEEKAKLEEFLSNRPAAYEALERLKEAAPEDEKEMFEKMKERAEKTRELRKERLEKMRESRKEILDEFRDKRKDIKEDFREGRKEIRKNFREDRREIMEDEDNDTLERKKRLRENRRESLKDLRENRKDAAEELRENRKDALEKAREEAKENKRNIVCTKEYKPVCGINEKTYSNRCVAIKQNGVRVAYEGRCKADKLRGALKELDKASPKLAD